MVQITESFLAKHEVEHATEVPCMHFYIDLVYRDEAGDLVAVEFKLHDWRRGLAQARGHRIAASRMFVCLPATRITDRLRDAAEQAGVGVFAWSPSNPLRVDVPAPRSKMLLSFAQEWLEEAFTESRSGGWVASHTTCGSATPTNKDM